MGKGLEEIFPKEEVLKKKTRRGINGKQVHKKLFNIS